MGYTRYIIFMILANKNIEKTILFMIFGNDNIYKWTIQIWAFNQQTCEKSKNKRWLIGSLLPQEIRDVDCGLARVIWSGFFEKCFLSTQTLSSSSSKMDLFCGFYGLHGSLQCGQHNHKPSPSPIPSSSGRRSRFMATSVKAWKTAGLKIFFKHEIPCDRVFSRFFVWVRSDFCKERKLKRLKTDFGKVCNLQA